MKLHTEVLGIRQREALLRLGPIVTPLGFYLGGGTAVALQIGHRKSLDLDWFTQEPIKHPLNFAQLLRDEGVPFVSDSEARGTLHGRVSGVQVSFLTYAYKLLRPERFWKDAHCRLASLDDLAAMKLSALSQRGAKKDFADLYALCLKHAPLSVLLKLYKRRFRVTDVGHLIYSLSYFQDADRERLPRMLWKVTWPTIKQAIRTRVLKLGR